MYDLEYLVEEMRQNLSKHADQMLIYGGKCGVNDDLLALSDLDVEICANFRQIVDVLKEHGFLSGPFLHKNLGVRSEKEDFKG